MFEDSDWRGFFWSSLPAGQAPEGEDTESSPLAVSLINAVCVSGYVTFFLSEVLLIAANHFSVLECMSNFGHLVLIFRIFYSVQILLLQPARKEDQYV